MNKRFETPSRTSPKGGRRGCLCKNDTYSIKCCNGSLRAQGIGQTSASNIIPFLSKEDGGLILQEDKYNIIL